MSKATDLQLTGAGAAYVRVSTNRQELERQLASVALFEKRHKVTIAKQHRYEDHGLPRDLSAKRPDFQRMMRAAEAGEIKWIVVDAIDRFGFADEWEFAGMVSRLRAAGCRLYDEATEEDWTQTNLMSFFKVGLAGHASKQKQVTTSHDCLGGMIDGAKNGEWMGGPPPLGFDVACFERNSAPDPKDWKELWRVVFEGRETVGTVKRKGKPRPSYRVLRRKLYPDGREERFDGEVVYNDHPDTKAMRIAPTWDTAKLEAARKVFERYAVEAVSFFDLAKWINDLGIRNSFGKEFQSNDIQKMLSNEAYLGFPTFRKRRTGRFKRYDAEHGVIDLEPELYGKDTQTDPADVIKSRVRLFEPLVDRKTWDAVRRKLAARKEKTKPRRAPKNAALYLAGGMLVCAGCGAPMQARQDRAEYYCATWDRHRTRGSLDDSPCERNGIRHTELEAFIDRYLTETGKKLEVMTAPTGGKHLTDPLRKKHATAWAGFLDGIERLTEYLAKHHPDELNTVLNEVYTQRAADEAEARAAQRSTKRSAKLPKGWLKETPAVRSAWEECKAGTATVKPDDYVGAVLECYRANVDPAAVEAEIKRLDADHDKQMEKWNKAPTPRSKEKEKVKLDKLEEDIEELEKQRDDAAGVVEEYYREIQDLLSAIANAQLAMKSESGAQAMRRRAEALRGVLVSIQCEFTSTGKKGVGRGNARSRLGTITFHPVVGSATTFGGDDGRKVNGGLRVYGKP